MLHVKHWQVEGRCQDSAEWSHRVQGKTRSSQGGDSSEGVPDEAVPERVGGLQTTGMLT